jgi:hypothetical protein
MNWVPPLLYQCFASRCLKVVPFWLHPFLTFSTRKKILEIFAFENNRIKNLAKSWLFKFCVEKKTHSFSNIYWSATANINISLQYLNNVNLSFLLQWSQKYRVHVSIVCNTQTSRDLTSWTSSLFAFL